MDNNTILMIVVAIVLGMLVANMLKDVCGCKNLIEGQGTEGWEQICGSGPPDDSSQECVLSTPAASECMNADPVVGCNCYEYSGPNDSLKVAGPAQALRRDHCRSCCVWSDPVPDPSRPRPPPPAPAAAPAPAAPAPAAPAPAARRPRRPRRPRPRLRLRLRHLKYSRHN